MTARLQYKGKGIEVCNAGPEFAEAWKRAHSNYPISRSGGGSSEHKDACHIAGGKRAGNIMAVLKILNRPYRWTDDTHASWPDVGAEPSGGGGEEEEEEEEEEPGAAAAHRKPKKKSSEKKRSSKKSGGSGGGGSRSPSPSRGGGGSRSPSPSRGSGGSRSPSPARERKAEEKKKKKKKKPTKKDEDSVILYASGSDEPTVVRVGTLGTEYAGSDRYGFRVTGVRDGKFIDAVSVSSPHHTFHFEKLRSGRIIDAGMRDRRSRVSVRWGDAQDYRDPGY
jgi:hypothetical protein